MSQQLIDITLIDPNPWQVRTSEDPEQVEKLASSILQDGLLQPPVARLVGDRYQLAFGHTRLAAFRLLGANPQPVIAGESEIPQVDFSRIPLEIRELDDETMFRQAVAENVQRKELTPIEEAQAMQRAMTDFGYTSAKVGELFGKTESTVRGIVRLLDLPEPVREKIGKGELTQNAARQLLTMQRVAPGKVEQTASNIADGQDPDDAIDAALRMDEGSVTMHHTWDGDKPHAGKGLWSLGTPPEKFPTLPALAAKDAAKALGLEFTAESREQLDGWIATLCSDGTQLWDIQTVASNLISQGAPADQIEKLVQLLQPPACTVCPFHAVADGTHYCGLKACHTRKRQAWIENELPSIAKRMKIAVFDPIRDGKEFIALNESDYGDNSKAHNKLVDDRHPDLRLQIHKSNYDKNKWTGSHNVRVILAGDTAKAIKEKERKTRQSGTAHQERERRDQELQNARSEAAREFERTIAAQAFAVAFKGLDNVDAMAALARVRVNKKATKAVQLAELRAELAGDALNNVLDWEHLRKGAEFLAKHLQGVAKSWDIRLPADWIEQAKALDPVEEQPVATATAKPAAKKAKKGKK